jgi:uncharacterized OB-fold protein
MPRKLRNGLCPRCGSHHDRPFAAYCIACHAAYMREWRKTHRLNPEQRRKDNCRSYSNMLLKRGHLTRQSCEACGSENSQMHHDDYDNPRGVRWFCRRCHLRHHQQEKTA